MNNEQEKARELAKLLNAFADGKQLQYKIIIASDRGFDWRDFSGTYNQLLHKIIDQIQFRIKPETRRIALNQQDLIDRVKENKTMWVKYEQFQCEYYLITSFSPLHVMFAGTEIDYDLLRVFGTFIDNSPCYKEVECE